MIDTLTGQIVTRRDDYVVLQVGGVGLRVYVPTSAYGALEGRGQTITLYTYLQVREDALTLFGFVDQDERALFETLLTVSGIGPRLALAIVGTLSLNQLSNAVASEQPELLTRVPGVGKKLAQKLGISGTPVVFFSNGRRLTGYAPPEHFGRMLSTYSKG